MSVGTCRLDIRACQSDSDDNKGLWDLQKGLNLDVRGNDQRGHTEQPETRKLKYA